MDGMHGRDARVLLGVYNRPDPLAQLTIEGFTGNPPVLRVAGASSDHWTQVFADSGPGCRDLAGHGIKQTWFPIPDGWEVGGAPGIEVIVDWADGGQNIEVIRPGDNAIVR